MTALLPFLPDLIASIGGLIASPLYDLIKKKWVSHGDDTPERTASTLATTNPDALSLYIDALTKLEDAKIKYFNRDVVGTISVWVSNFRASIRPLTVVASLIFLFLDGFGAIDLGTGARVTFELCVTSWMGDRFTLKK